MAPDIYETLVQLGHGDPKDPNASWQLAIVKRFQRHVGLAVDGVVGPKTFAAIESRRAALARAHERYGPMPRLQPLRITSYYLADQKRHTGPAVPLLDKTGKVIATAPAAFFAELALEGSGLLTDGRLLNVDGTPIAPPSTAAYQPAVEWYQSQRAKAEVAGRDPKPPTYFGLTLGTGGDLKAVKPFRVVPRDEYGCGYGVQRRRAPDGQAHTIQLEPWKTLAADLGLFKTSEPRFKKKGGLIPVATKVLLLERMGQRLPSRVAGVDGWCDHDGFYTVCDTGGGIFGAHVDQFVGTRELARLAKPLERAHAYFVGVEARCPAPYTYGLYDS